jgi:hypothetical protein
MKSVLMISYFFPPEGSAGTYRSLRFVRQLTRVGWSPAVIAADPYNYERYDPDLLALVPSDVEVTRVRGRDPWQALQNWRGKKFQETISGASTEVVNEKRAVHYKPFRSLLRKAVHDVENSFYQPDLARPWVRPAVSAAIKACRNKRPDVLWASAGPVSAWIVAHKVSRATNVPYVLDLRDPHGLSYYDPELKRPEWVVRRMRRTMYRLFKDARAVVFLFDSVAECYYRAFPGALDPARIHIIPNGYEGNIEESVPPSGNTFNILYAGTVVSYRYDTFLQAVAALKRSAPDKTDKLRIRFVGEGMEEVAKLVRSLKISNLVETTGPTTNAEVSVLERQAHALLVLGRLSTIAGHELFAGAKVFNYLKANRPIFGVLPRDETRKVLESVGIPTIADVDSRAEISAQLEKLIDAWSMERLHFLMPDRAKCQVYSAEQQTIALARALAGGSATQPFVRGSAKVPPSLRAMMTAQGARVSDYGWI